MPHPPPPDDFDSRIETERLKREAEAKAADERELQSFANAIGVGDNLKLAKHIRFLQRRLTQLEEVVAELREELRKR